MILELSANKRFIARVSYEERNIPKDRGFVFSNKEWWTTDPKKIEGLPCTPEAAKFRDFKLSRYALSYSTDSKFQMQNPKDLAFLPYQRAAIEVMLQEKYTLLADEPGVGKTATAIGYINCAKPKRTLIIVPASVRLNWIRELQRWLTVPAKILIVEGRSLENISADIVVTSYDLLSQKYLMKMVNDWNPNVLITDEGHYLKEPKSQRTRSIYSTKPFKDENIVGLVRKIDKYINITGTPIVNRPMEFWPFISSCAKAAISPYDNMMSFGRYFCKGYKKAFAWDFTGSQHEEVLNRMMRESCMIRRTLAQVQDQIPKKQFQIIELEPKGVLHLIEKEHELSDFFTYSEQRANKTAKSLQIEGDDRPLIAQLAEIKQQIALAKVPAIVEIAKNILASGDKLVVFAVHKVVVTALRDALCEFNPSMIVGGQSMNQRQSEILNFTKKEDSRVLIGNLDAAGVGIDGLQHVCHRALFAEVGHTPSGIEQAIGRLCRTGQKLPVLAQFIAYKDSVDQWMIQGVIKKDKIIKKLLT